MTGAGPSSRGPTDAEPGAEVSRVVERLRDRIRRGLAAPGQRQIEADIVTDTGAPRAKVREALRRLQLDGLVTIEPFRGASVRRLGRREIAEIYAVRGALEGLAARLAAANGSAPGKHALARLQNDLNSAQGAGDGPRFVDANQRWRHGLLDLADNAVLKDQLDRLHTPTLRLLFQTFYAPEVISRANASLRQVTAAVVAGQSDRADAAMCDHVRHGLQVIEALGDEYFADP